jgi:hypothetical protein
MKLYIEKPKTVAAMQWDGTEKMAIEISSDEKFEGMLDYRQRKFFAFWMYDGDREYRVHEGDYILKDWNGTYSMVPKKLFEKSFEEVKE